MDPKFVIPSRHHLSAKLTADAVGAKTVELQKVLAVSPSCFCYFGYLDGSPYAFFYGNSTHLFACKANAFLLSFEAFKGSHTGVRIAEKYEKTLLVNCLVGKVDCRLTDNASNMRKAFDVTASFHDEETSLAITCITACIAI